MRYLRRFHNGTDGTVVATDELRARLEGAGFRNVSVLGRGVDTALFNPARRSAALRAARGAGDDDLVGLHVGRLASEKNVPLVVDAYHAMRAAGCRVRCVLVGDGPMRRELQTAACRCRSCTSVLTIWGFFLLMRFPGGDGLLIRVVETGTTPSGRRWSSVPARCRVWYDQAVDFKPRRSIH